MSESSESGGGESRPRPDGEGRGRHNRRRRRRGRGESHRPEARKSANQAAGRAPGARPRKAAASGAPAESREARDASRRRRPGRGGGGRRPPGRAPAPRVIIPALPAADGLPVLVDTHAHLIDKAFDPDRRGAVERAIEARVRYVISMGSCLESSRRTADLAVSYAGVHAAVGVHPSEVGGADERTIKGLARLLDSPKVAAVGEIGLDYYREGAPRKLQRRWFREQIRLAVEARKPIAVHCRDAAEDVLSILEEERAWRAGGVIHCFTGGAGEARRFLDMDFHLGAGGAIAFSRSEELREVFAGVPMERVLLETDSPHLAPPPHRGGRNEPAYLVRVAETLAELRGVPVEEAARATTENARRLFGVGPPPEEGRVAYVLGDALYLNITNECQNACFYCGLLSDRVYRGRNLALGHEPDLAEVLAAAGDPSRFSEVVFSGFGEPTLRLDLLKEAAGELKRRGARRVRLTTNGLANRTHGRNVLPELRGLVDAVSVSLQAESPEAYAKVCKTKGVEDPYPAVKEFIRWAKNCIPEVEVTAVAMPGLIDVEACRKVAAEELGAPFRAREYVMTD